MLTAPPLQSGSSGIIVTAVGCQGELWLALCSGADAVCAPPLSRCDPQSVQGQAVLPGHFVARAELFDHRLFSMSMAEVRVTDPNQRVLLQVVLTGLVGSEHQQRMLLEAGIGVFVGFGQTPWLAVQQQLPASVFSGHGVVASAAAGRISYTLGLQGP